MADLPVLADNLQRAKLLVSEHVAVTSQRVELDRTLTESEITVIGLEAGNGNPGLVA